MNTINTLKKVTLSTVLTFVLSFSSVFAQNDTIYIMKSGVIVGQYNVITEVDSIIFYNPTIEEKTSGIFTDSRDGNVYKWVKIGNQVWMAENLKYLPSVVGPGVSSQTTPYYYVYDYSGNNVADAKATANYTTYGVLYNWTAACNSCPTGWHLPSDAEWTQMENYLADNGHNYDGTTGGGSAKITKSLASTSGWNSSSSKGAVGNTDYPTYRNKSDFTALPGGKRFLNGGFFDVGSLGWWWSATDIYTGFAWFRQINTNSSSVYRDYDVKELSFSVRCVRD